MISEILILKIETQLVCQNKTNIESFRFYLMHFGFALDLLDTDIRTFYLSPRRLEEVFKTCLQDVFQACLQEVFKTGLKDIFPKIW